MIPITNFPSPDSTSCLDPQLNQDPFVYPIRKQPSKIFRSFLLGCLVISLCLTGVLTFGSGSAWARRASSRHLENTLARDSLTSSPSSEVGSGSPSAFSIQPYLDQAQAKITTFELDNGLKFIVLERHRAPVVSFVTYANVGSANEPTGQTGVAHFLEHLAFKGTSRIGTTDYAAEKPILEQLDQIFEQILIARSEDDQAKLEKLEAEFEQLQAKASEYVKQNEYAQIVDREGGVGLNATTSMDVTTYFYSFPSHKLELWMSLESERFLDPVFREFAQEKDVILEERRQRSENSPIGQMIEAFQAEAFHVHPYGDPVIGFTEDIQNLTRQNVRDFFETHYVPSNLAVAIVGDVDPDQVKQLAEVYFGRFPTRPLLQDSLPIEPLQTEPRQIELALESEPWYLEGYHIPAVRDPDFIVHDMIAALLSNGRTSRLYQALVENRIALSVQSQTGFPGDKDPNLIFLYALSAPGHTLAEVETAIETELNRLKTELVDQSDLDRIKTQVQASLIRSLDSNLSMARLLLEYEIKTGSWQNLFNQLQILESITPADIQRVAQSTFRPENRTVGRLIPKS